MRILITGGAGFIGLKLTNQLLETFNEVEIVVVDSLTSQIHGQDPDIPFPENVTFIQSSVGDLKAQDVRGIDVLFHLAAETGTGQSAYEIEKYVDVNERQYSHLLQLLTQQDHQLKKVILPSSRSVYGEGCYTNQEGARIQIKSRSLVDLERGNFEPTLAGSKISPVATKEDDDLSPSSIYAATKLNQEILTKAYCETYGIPYTIFRLQNVYGPGQSLANPYTGIVSIFTNLARQNININVYEDGKESRDFVFVDDVATIMTYPTLSDNLDNDIFNIGSGTQTTVYELAEKIKYYLNSSSDIKITGDYRIGDIRHCYADQTKLTSKIEKFDYTSLEDGLPKFLEWAKLKKIYKDNTPKANEQSKAMIDNLLKKKI